MATPRRCSKTLAEEGANHFSNGWAWLVLDRGKLKITSLHDADTPLVHDGMTPLFTLDVWEHAYYIDYRNERPKFADAVLSNIVNWDFVAQNLDGEGAKRADQDSAAEPRTGAAFRDDRRLSRHARSQRAAIQPWIAARSQAAIASTDSRS